ncbi:Serralysin A [Carnimonas sp. R-84981]|uniref:M10 family metallopeptidase C-terminal domain-containing protein n=1 Tax=Carnimonas bestiolae TaxID=3402172 RepID=UPI003EDC841B
MSTYYNTVEQILRDNQRGDFCFNGLPSFTTNDAAAALLRIDYRWPEKIYSPNTITYSFMNRDNFPGFDPGFTTFQEFSEPQKASARTALQSWSDVANIQFFETDGSADIMFAIGTNNDESSGITWPYSVSDRELVRAHVWMKPFPNDPSPGNYEYQALTHEIGHALGLAHPGDYDAQEGDIFNLSYARNAAYLEDATPYTIMSYWTENNVGADFEGQNLTGPMIDDITAIQTLYGPNTSSFLGDTIYGFDSNTDRERYTLTSDQDKPVFTVWNSSGENTFNFSQYSNDQLINLQPGSFSNVGGLKMNVSIAYGATVDNIISGSGNDILIGNDNSNYISGGAGNDIIYGGRGADVLEGGPGHNVFVYTQLSDSTPDAPDCILDFQTHVDKIDLSGIAIKCDGVVNSVYDEGNNFTRVTVDVGDQTSMLINVVGQVDIANDIIMV